MEFRTAVDAACTKATVGLLDDAAATVDPFGSESYGLALVTGAAKGSSRRASVICVYDKKTKEAEVGGILDLPSPDAATAAAPAPSARPLPSAAVEAPSARPLPAAADAPADYPFKGDCDDACRTNLAVLVDADRRQIAALPDQVLQTLAETRGGDETSGIAFARMAAERLARATAGETGGEGALKPAGAVAAGTRACTVYWFGFLDKPSQKVGSHRCKIDKDETEVRVTKLTGDGLTAQFLPLAGDLSAYAGRSYLAEQTERDYDGKHPDNEENANFGNKVGLAGLVDDQLALVSIDERGMSPQDPTFFEVIVVDR
ncbi:hypothetical protein [Mangrovicella endophytica]|uniref:hypothetical protein n=1 Tax=Mangrovicella endophytica TaxID=2066697 RepID=UPI001FDFE6A2|nr:hypothetical protein [Mangrovicella endophytica]